MHSYIFQIHTEPIVPEDYPSEDKIAESSQDFVDYATELEDESRSAAIAYLFKFLYESEMFAINDDETATYIGGFEKALKRWAEDIKDYANQINTKNILNFRSRYHLSKAINNPLDKSYLFITSDSDSAERSEALYELIATMKPGDRLYIGGVYDYHF